MPLASLRDPEQAIRVGTARFEYAVNGQVRSYPRRPVSRGSLTTWSRTEILKTCEQPEVPLPTNLTPQRSHRHTAHSANGSSTCDDNAPIASIELVLNVLKAPGNDKSSQALKGWYEPVQIRFGACAWMGHVATR